MRGRSAAAAAAGACSTRWSPPARPPVRRTVFHYGAEAVAGHDAARAAGVDALLRAAPHRARPAAGRRGRPRPAPTVRFGTAVTGLLPRRRRPGHRRRAPGTGGGAVRDRARRRWWSVPTARDVAGGRRGRRAGRGRRPGARRRASTATGPGLPTDGYEWFYRPGAERRRHPHQRRADLRVRRRPAGRDGPAGRRRRTGRGACRPLAAPGPLGPRLAAAERIGALRHVRASPATAAALPRPGLGAGRRRRVLEGPAEHARHDRRAARRRAAGPGGARRARARTGAGRGAGRLPGGPGRLSAADARRGGADRLLRLGPGRGAAACCGRWPAR